MEQTPQYLPEITPWEGDKTLLNTFYEQCGYHYEPQSDEEIVVAKIGEDIVGAVRLCHENGVLVLRGMQVRDDQRGHGLGTKMLQELQAVIGDRECYCLPYAHLGNFYGQIGFEIVGEDDVPDFLRERIQSYRNKKNGKSYMLMVRRTSSK
jgi:N-acetylglutamate synthase-like GNAT family acetyltransferase